MSVALIENVRAVKLNVSSKLISTKCVTESNSARVLSQVGKVFTVKTGLYATV